MTGRTLIALVTTCLRITDALWEGVMCFILKASLKETPCEKFSRENIAKIMGMSIRFWGEMRHSKCDARG